MRNKIIIIATILLLATTAFSAEPEFQPKTREQIDYAPFPQPDSGYVTDEARLLTRDQEEKIERWLWQTESRTGVEIVVVTIDSISDFPDTPRTIEAFARQLFDKYGIGNLPQNDGVLLLVAASDRKARIELGAAYGRTRDGDAERIMQRVIIPRFKTGDYAAGVTDGVKALMKEFAGVRVGTNWGLIFWILAIPVLGLIGYSLIKSGKRGWGWICIGFIIIPILAILWTMVKVGQHMPKSESGSWSSGGFGGGFGGGSSGGGGATGSW